MVWATGVALSGILAACGSSSGGDSAGPASNGQASKSAVNAAVSARQGSDGKQVLVDASGKTLYFSDEEKNGRISCTGSCLGFWFPVTVSGKTVPTPDGVQGKLSTQKRSDDGKLQVTLDGAPLYTFKLDTSPGDMKGNNFSDEFGSMHFTWHAADAAGTSGSTSTPSSADSGSGGNGGGYGGY